jgi:hypothetical protein
MPAVAKVQHLANGGKKVNALNKEHHLIDAFEIPKVW